ncbi:unnamed protein product [Adineta steineri]|uniref:Uncharacterized protein n=1 Tax=Adineta steineri TaxID=433720 RepID=A0A815MAI8_9BILA|nr:unnamed protein product [Adineta steineri]CAF1416751.1 unnamed protein product [Adineta steineri]
MESEQINFLFNCASNLRLRNSLSSSHEFSLSDLCPKKLAAWGAEHPADLNYRVELARRIASTYDDADQIIIFDDIATTVPDCEYNDALFICGFNRALLPALWLSTGFRCGGRILVYSPPNSIEIENYLKLKKLIEENLHRSINIQILYEDLTGRLLNLVELFEKSSENYANLCEEFAQQFSKAFYPKYHVDMLQRHIETITQGTKQSFVFPFEMTKIHLEALLPYSDRLKLPDMPTNDKAKHNLFLRAKGFNCLPKLLAVSPNGSLIDNYEQYIDALKQCKLEHTENTLYNIEIFARTIIEAVDQIYQKYNTKSFVKLDATGVGGLSGMSPSLHPIIYDYKEDKKKRVDYLCKYIEIKLKGTKLPTTAVVEEFIEPQKRVDDVDATYGVCGFVLGGIFFPTSINLAETPDASYIGMWISSSPADIPDSPTEWQQMFQEYSCMVALEASEFHYHNGIYAGNLFLTKDGCHKIHDWNIRRGGRSTPESLIIFDMPIYETKFTLFLNEFGYHEQISRLNLFRIYNKICESLMHNYGIYVFSTEYSYFGKGYVKDDFFKFNLMIHPKWLVNIDNNGEKQNLPKSKHRNKVEEFIRETTKKCLQDMDELNI